MTTVKGTCEVLQENLKELQRAADNYKNLGCRNCKHIIKEPRLGAIPARQLCRASISIHLDPVDGATRRYSVCRCRNYNNQCKDFSPSLWYRLKQLFRRR